MNKKKDLEPYFKNNMEATYITRRGDFCLQSVDREGNQRVIKAHEQISYAPVNLDKVIEYTNDFFCELTGCEKNTKSIISLDNVEQEIHGYCILAKQCKWKAPVYDDKLRKYTFYDKKYNKIKTVFNLDFPNDIVWLKFLDSGHLGVVADSFDVNYSYNTSSGKLVKTVNRKWNENIVVIVPITLEIKKIKNRKEIETGLGNYLEARNVPIIDFYSHSNF